MRHEVPADETQTRSPDARARATAIISGDRSIAVTSAPRFAAALASRPAPQPTSRSLLHVGGICARTKAS